MKTDELYQKIETFLVEKLNPSYIIVFGSYAKGAARHESDIDVAFYSEGEKRSAYELFILAQELADIINREADLIDLATASTVFKAQIFSTGEAIYTKDKGQFYLHRMTALSMYAKLNEDRAPILEEIKKRGTIYGK